MISRSLLHSRSCSVLAAVLITAAVGLSISPEAFAGDPPPFVREWGSPGSGDGQFDRPLRLNVSEWGTILVADTENDRIQVFELDGTHIQSWGVTGGGDGQFLAPSGVGTDFAENVYVADAGNHRIQKFARDGTYLAQWGTMGSGPGQFQSPAALAVNSFTGEVYVADTLNHRIQRFSSTGSYLGEWGSSGAADGQFDSPEDVVYGNDDRICVADTGNDRIQVFDVDGTYLLQWGSSGSGPGQFESPVGVGFDCLNQVYVADTGNHRIQQFDSFGAYVSEWGTLGSGPGEFSGPTSISSLPTHGVVGLPKSDLGGLFVADRENHRIQQFDGPLCPSFSCAEVTATVAEPAHMMITPSGEGPTLAEQDATVYVEIMDTCNGVGIPNYPFQDIWLDDDGNGEISLCQGGSVADGNTDANGQTTISHAIAGGGWTVSGMKVYVGGVPIEGPTLPLDTNSPDLNGDRVVDLSDLGQFAADYLDPAYQFRTDLTGEGIENLSDIGRFAIYYGDECP